MIKHYVITMTDVPASVDAANRCITSGKRFGIDIETWVATTPQNTDIAQQVINHNIPLNNFKEKYSRLERCVAAFLSHYSLWQHAVQSNQEITVFEHDAVVVLPIDQNIKYNGCINLGKPSYGKYNDPLHIGVNPLTSKRYFPGAHAYRITAQGARKLLEQVQSHGKPTDLFLNTNTFPWLEEYYPWPVEAMDTFTTIQNQNGCRAKHNYGQRYKII